MNGKILNHLTKCELNKQAWPHMLTPPINHTHACRVTITYVDREGKNHTVQGKVGDNALYLAHRHEIEMEGTYIYQYFDPFIFVIIIGACEASLACTTCHVYVDGCYGDKLPEAHEE